MSMYRRLVHGAATGAALLAATAIADAQPSSEQSPSPQGKTPPALETRLGTDFGADAFGAPLLVLDMYEHAYAIDYGADHAAYIDAFFKNVAWDAVEARYDRAMKA